MMRIPRLSPRLASWALVVMLGVSITAWTQQTTVTGNLGGQIVDPTGSLVPGATVTITGQTVTKSLTSDAEGHFLFQNLTPGIYALKIEKQGFKSAELKRVQVVIDRTASVRVPLEVGTVTETVEVSATAVTIDPTSVSVGANLPDTFYASVPVARNVAGLFYTAPGVADGGGTGAANPSISGSSGLENLYIADGVNITDSAFGGLGVWNQAGGFSVGTGINLSFVKEVQVKTAGFEPQYGQATGGIVQMVTKSGSREWHGEFAAYGAPRGTEATRPQPDDSRITQAGRLLHEGNFDASAEFGGYVPHFREHLFVFGSYNPSWGYVYAQPPEFNNARLMDPNGLYAMTNGRTFALRSLTHSYAAKLTYQINSSHTLESSVFGDPASTGVGPWYNVNVANATGFTKWDYGTRNWVTRYNAVFSPSWLLNTSFSWNTNDFSDIPAMDVPFMQDRLVTPVTLQGFGYIANHKTNNFAFTVDTTKVGHFAGEHSFLFGYHQEFLNYDNLRDYSGGRFPIPTTNADGTPLANIEGTSIFDCNPSDPNCPVGKSQSVVLYLRAADPAWNCTLCPFYKGTRSYYQVYRSLFNPPVTNPDGKYKAAYINDTWTLNKYVNFNIGLRWEQYRMTGLLDHHVFVDNWSPRIGVSVDPTGNRKTKISVHYARYNYQMPLDAAIRSLSSETYVSGMRFAPASDANGNAILNENGAPQFVNDGAHVLNWAANGIPQNMTLTGQSITAFWPGTRMQYEDEWVAGFERDMGHGIMFTARYIDRRLKRMVEDIAGVSPEGYNAGLPQTYYIANPSSTSDYFVNESPTLYTPANAEDEGPCGTGIFANPILDANSNTWAPGQAMCWNNVGTATNELFGGEPIPDGIPDGFPDPVRNYQGVELEVNKAFSAGWMMRANFRVARLYGNYEGAFRNDNGQSDPSISSLFDFTQGVLGMLGDQFNPGPLPTDRRYMFNAFFSYTFPKSMLKNLTLGTRISGQSGTPVSEFADHPAYQNAGEVPIGGRGKLGRTPFTGYIDFHTDYPFKMTEKLRMFLVADLFNITNNTRKLNVDQNRDLSGMAPFSNPDFKKVVPGGLWPQPVPYQRPFYARFGLRFVF